MLTLNGYQLPKDSRELALKKALTVRPFSFVNPMAQPKYPVYHETKTHLYVPKHFGIERFGIPTTTRDVPETSGRFWDFTGSLRPVQLPVVNSFLLPEPHDGIISLHTGGGKTVCALYIASRLRVPALVVVHNTFLRDQWIDRVKAFLPNARIGLRNEDTSCDTFIRDFTIRVDEGVMKYKRGDTTPNFKLLKNIKTDELIDLAKIVGSEPNLDSLVDIIPSFTSIHDITVGMIQGIVQKKVNADEFRPIGLVIVDECHHIASEVFVQALPKVTSKYMLGLSATPDRKDKLMYAIHWFLGPLLYKSETGDSVDTQVNVEVYEYKNDDPEFNEIVMSSQGMVSVPIMVNKLTGCEDRTKWLCGILEDISEGGRQILVLSDRVQHCQDILAGLSPELRETACILGTAVKPELRTEYCKTKAILIATYSMCKEGFDVPTLNTLVMATPRPDIDQIVGRILRVEKKGRVVHPLIVDIVDPQFRRQFGMRNGLYKKRQYRVTKMALPPL
uniref:Helicase ATP-binding domain-containing protein n=1 Tax=viral metagenome TaxID=1070528 RepID=A0A6C0AJL6_9ZZZZ